MVGAHGKPVVAVFVDLLAQMPGGNIGANTGIHQIVFMDAVGFELWQVYAVDLRDAVVHCAVAVAAHRIGLPAAFLPENARKNPVIHAMMLRRTHDAVQILGQTDGRACPKGQTANHDPEACASVVAPALGCLAPAHGCWVRQNGHLGR